MLRRTFLLALALVAAASAQPVSKPQPKLVLVIVVDQFRYDYLPRFESEFSAGLKRLLEGGAVFTQAHYESAPTVTAVGHATILSGAMPAVSGIIGNDWWSREEGKRVMSITDDAAAGLGGMGSGASPRRLLVSTIGDELKIAGRGGKAIGISLKDRSAILPAGHMADGAYWFDNRSGNIVSSDYYFPALPAWAAEFNSRRLADQFAGKQWMGQTMPAEPGPQLYRALDATPFGDELTQQFALHALAEEQLGMGVKIDLLSVSYSSVDYVGHEKGPDSPEIHDMILRIDKLAGELIDAAERQAGAGNVLALFTADHGIPPIPEWNVARNMPGGRVSATAERRAVEEALAAKFGPGDYLDDGTGSIFYFKADSGVDHADLERAAASVLRQLPHVARVYTRSSLTGAGLGDRIDQRVRNGFNAARSGDVFVVHDPYWQGGGGTGTNHGSPYNYDTHVPIVFFGGQGLIQPGQYHGEVAVNDIAPTLSQILGIATPSGSTGRVLHEMLR